MMFMLLSIRMVPGAASVVPMFMMYTALGWKSTHFGIIMFYAMFSIPFSVWILKGFLDGVSTKLTRRRWSTARGTSTPCSA